MSMSTPKVAGASVETRVSDQGLSAYLIAHGHTVMRIEGSFGRRVLVFKNVPESAVAAYYSGTDATAARTLYSALRDVKGLMQQQL
jgi:hypothetical protein